MRRLAMYQGPPTSPVDSGALPLDRSCTKCSWSTAGPTKKSCLPADGTPGGLLVVGDAPNRDAVRPFASKTGAYVRDLVRKSWSGPVVYDYAVKCSAGRFTKLKDAATPIKECRPYLAEVLQQARPERVLAIGSWAALGLLGRGLDMESARRAYGWVLRDVPVFVLHGPMAALENRFIRERYERDFAWALTRPRPTPSHVGGVVHVVEDLDDALQAEEALSLHEELLFDVETAGLPHGPDFTVLCAGLAAVDELEGDSWVWSGDSDNPGLAQRGALSDPDCLMVLRRILSRHKISGSNIKYDVIAAAQCLGVDIPSLAFDTQLVRKLIDPLAMGRLEYVVELVGMGGSKEEAADLRKKATMAARRKKWRPGEKPHDHWCVQAIRNGAEPNRYNFALLPDDVLWRYNGRDVAGSAAGTIHLRDRTRREAPHELAIWEALYLPAIPSFKRIERTGIQVDRQAFETFSAFLNVGLSELAEKFKAWGPDFNPASPKQVAEILFEKLKLPKGKVSEKSGDASTDKEVLEGLRGRHQFVDDMIEFRRLEKMDGTYAAGMIPKIRPDGRIHPSFRLDGTETGRISGEDPNPQNLPRAETVEGKMCRDCFVASPGNVLIELDQSQIELRVAAGMSGDEEMIAIFLEGLDYHFRTAQLIARLAWGISEADVTDWHRSYCKCFHPDTEVMTRSGWKKIVSLGNGEEVMSCEPCSGHVVKMGWIVPTEVFTAVHPAQELVHFRNEGIDVRVTPDHGMLAFDKNGEPQQRVLPADFPKKRSWANAGCYVGASDERDEMILRLAVATQADGSITSTGGISFGFTKARKIGRLTALLDLAGLAYSEKVAGRVTRIYVKKDDAKHVLCLLDRKSFPWWWLELVPLQKEVVLEEASRWDSTIQGSWKMFRYDNKDEQSVDVLQAIATTSYRKTRKVLRSGGVFSLSVRDHHVTRSGNLRVTKERWTGHVACLTVPSGCVVVRDGGVPLITNQTVNFGLMYGKTDAGLAQQLGCTIDEARKLRQAILGRFKKFAAMIKKLLHHARTKGGIDVPWLDGAYHTRPLYEVAGHDKWKRNNAENSSINTPIQGRAAWYTLASIPPIHAWIDEVGATVEIVNTVHDSILLDCPPDWADRVVEAVKRIMTSFDCWGVPLVADCKIGDRWGSLRKVKKGETYADAQVRWIAEALLKSPHGH